MTYLGKRPILALLALFLAMGPAAARGEGHGPGSDVAMAMHHMHMMINQAVALAAEGSNLIMLGEMGMTPEMDALSIEQGKKMMADAEAMVARVMSGEEMKSLHARMHGSREVAAMVDTHELSKAAMAYLEQLKKMTSAHLLRGKQ